MRTRLGLQVLKDTKHLSVRTRRDQIGKLPKHFKLYEKSEEKILLGIWPFWPIYENLA